VQSNNTATFRNFWVATYNVTRFFRGNDAQMTRGGPAMGSPLGGLDRVAAQQRRQYRLVGQRQSPPNELGDHDDDVVLGVGPSDAVAAVLTGVR
jgi:hypothetical protein